MTFIAVEWPALERERRWSSVEHRSARKVPPRCMWTEGRGRNKKSYFTAAATLTSAKHFFPELQGKVPVDITGAAAASQLG